MATAKSFETRAKLGYALLVLLLAAGMAYSIHRLSNTADEQTEELRSEEHEVTLIERLRWSSELVVSSGRAYLLAGEPELLTAVQTARASTRTCACCAISLSLR